MYNNILSVVFSQSDKCFIPESTVLALATEMCEETFLATQEPDTKGETEEVVYYRIQPLVYQG